jgi:hypothetical protein
MIAPRIIKKFALGQLVATPGALSAIERAGQSPSVFIERHLKNDWGEVCNDDWNLNDQALDDGDRILSAYRTSLDERIWVISESDRSATTILLPDEY